MTSLRFRTTEFDCTGPVSPESNAGNQFYGQDVARFIGSGLDAAGYVASVFDEDWGWMVSALVPDTSVLEVAIYNLNEHGEGGRPGAPDWGLWMRYYATHTRFGFWKSRREVPTTHAQRQALERIFAAKGITLEQWTDGPDAE